MTKNKKHFTKLIRLWGVVALTGIGSLIAVIDMASLYSGFNDQAGQIRKSYLDQNKQMIRREVMRAVDMIYYQKAQSEVKTRQIIQERTYEAWSIAQNIYLQNRLSKSKADIQTMIINALRPVRYENGRGYYFITRLDGHEILFADKPEMEGKNLLEMQDTKGQFVIKDMIKIVSDDEEGFYDYYWTKPDTAGSDFKKIAFLKKFEPFDWFIGTGLYCEDITDNIKKELLTSISMIRFGKEGYIFINTFNGDALISNGLYLGGTKKLWEVFSQKPEKIKKIYQMSYEAAQKPGGDYIYYSMIKLTDDTVESPKTSFLYGIPEWQWYVGAGVYLDDLEKEIVLIQKKLTTHITRKGFYSLLIITGTCIVFLSFFNWITRRFKKDFSLFTNFFHSATHADTLINRDLIQFSELDGIAKNANQMLQDKFAGRQKLRDERERLFVTIRSIGDGVITTDTSGNIVLMNRVAERLTGWNTDTAIGKKLTNVFRVADPLTKKEIDTPLYSILKNDIKSDKRNLVLLVSRNDNNCQIDLSASPIKDFNGVVTGVVIVFRDVSEEYQMRERLLQSEANMRLIFEAAINVGFVKTDCKGTESTILDFSPGAEQIFGYSAREAIGKSISFFYPREQVDCFPGFQKTKSKDKEGFNGEYTLLKKTGEALTVLFTADPVFDINNVLTAVIWVFIDISERKKSEEALRYRIKLEKIISSVSADFAASSPEQLYVEIEHMLKTVGEFTQIDRSYFFLMSEDGSLMHNKSEWCAPGIQPQITSLQNLSANLLPWWRGNMSITEVVHIPSIKDLPEPKAYEKLTFLSRGIRSLLCVPLTYEKKLIGFAGFDSVKQEKHWSEEDHLLLTTMGNILVHTLIRKQTENEIQKMERLKSVGTLAGGIAHDFNNILLGLFGNISMAKNELDDDHPGLRYLHEAEGAMNRATRLTKQLLTFSKGGEPVKETTSLEQFAEKTIRFDLSGSNIKPVFTHDSDLWLADVDKGQMQQVFSNLTINARQAMPDGGHLFVDFNNISSEPSADSLHGNDHAEYIRITFQDEGTGIDPKNLDRIFDPYFSTKQTGSGLGLATVFSIITKHGGNISVESEQGKGTKFILHIPASKNKPVSDLKNNLMKPVTEAKGGRILVMDDEEILCDVISKMLTAGGFSVLTTSTGESAIAEYQKAMEKGMPYDAVIMDLTIPGGMGGKEAIKDILALNPDARVIVSSGYADDPVMANYSDYGFKGIIAKPYTMGNLQKVMDTLLAQ